MKEKPDGKTQPQMAVRCSALLGVKNVISQNTRLVSSVVWSFWNFRRHWASLHLRKFCLHAQKFGINCGLFRLKLEKFCILLVIRLKCWPYGKEVWTNFSGGRSVKDKFLDDIKMLSKSYNGFAVLTPNDPS